MIEPAANDARFKHPAWSENPAFDALKQGYLLASQAMLDGIDRAEGIDPETKARVKFFAKQFCDAMSPTNVAFLNPAVIEETLRTGGANLQRGAQNAIEDLQDNNGRPALVDKKAFAVGKNVATTPGQVVYRNDLIELIQYAPTTETVFARPLVITPPSINKYYILDLQPANSLIKFSLDCRRPNVRRVLAQPRRILRARRLGRLHRTRTAERCARRRRHHRQPRRQRDRLLHRRYDDG